MTDTGGSGWRPKILRDGQEPDPRFTLANERTFLAWIRTSLGLTAGAVALEAFAGEEIPEIIRTPVACILLVLAAVLAIVAFRRWITSSPPCATQPPHAAGVDPAGARI